MLLHNLGFTQYTQNAHYKVFIQRTHNMPEIVVVVSYLGFQKKIMCVGLYLSFSFPSVINKTEQLINQGYKNKYCIKNILH